MQILSPSAAAQLPRPSRAACLHYAARAYAGRPVVAELEQRLARQHGAAACVAVCSESWALALAIRALALPGRTCLLAVAPGWPGLVQAAGWAGLDTGLVLPGTLASTTVAHAGLLVAAAGTGWPMAVLGRSVGLPVLSRSAGGPIHAASDAELLPLPPCIGGGCILTGDAALTERLTRLRDGTAGDGLHTDINPFQAAMALAALDGEQQGRIYRAGLAGVPALRVLPAPAEDGALQVEVMPGWPLSCAETLGRLHDAGVPAGVLDGLRPQPGHGWTLLLPWDPVPSSAAGAALLACIAAATPP